MFRSLLLLAIFAVSPLQAQEGNTSTCFLPELTIDTTYHFKTTNGNFTAKVKEIIDGHCWIKVKEKLDEVPNPDAFVGKRKVSYYVNLANVITIKKGRVATSAKKDAAADNKGGK